MTTRLTDAVVAFLTEIGWPHEVDGTMVRTVVRTDEVAYPCAVVVVEDLGQLVVYCVHPDRVDDPSRSLVGELATRANSRLTVGNLEIDLDEGQVRFRTGLAVGDSPVTEEMVKRVIYDNAASAVAYFPLVSAVVDGSMTPTEAVTSLE
ncbi:MAG: YbjN domain-containing protein [Acidimicrobiales bacterium]